MRGLFIFFFLLFVSDRFQFHELNYYGLIHSNKHRVLKKLCLSPIKKCFDIAISGAFRSLVKSSCVNNLSDNGRALVMLNTAFIILLIFGSVKSVLVCHSLYFVTRVCLGYNLFFKTIGSSFLFFF